MNIEANANSNQAVDAARARLTEQQTTARDLHLDLKSQRLRIEWADGVHSVYDLAELRRRCPCATCRAQEARPTTSLPILNPSRASGVLRATNGRLVGNYALAMEFSDGHNTGIYDYAYLRALDVAKKDSIERGC
jgi:ATP-binding protein involved in chromosome partitioning